MYKKLIILLVLIFVISGCTSRIPDSEREFDILANDTDSIDKSVCGDEICSISEDCNNCVEDCGCKNEEECSSEGVCEKEICGNSKCSEDERNLDNCCQDCGCDNGFICNIVIQKCQTKISLEESIVNKTVNDYLNENDIIGRIIETRDTYFNEELIKEVSVDCKTEDMPYPCQIILFIDEEGNIVDEMRSS